MGTTYSSQIATSICVSERSMHPARRISIYILSACAVGLAAYLAMAAFKHGHVAGCDGGSGCGEVLSSSWSSWLGIPVSALALCTYLCLMIATWAEGRATSRWGHASARAAMDGIGALIIASAVWFTAVMSVKLDAFCPYCLASHALGLIIAFIVLARRRSVGQWSASIGGVVLALFGVGTLIAGQILMPVQTYKILSDHAHEDAHHGGHGRSADQVHSHDEPSKMSAEAYNPNTPYDTGPGPNRRITLPRSDAYFELSEMAVMGLRDAAYVLTFFGDYTCPHCQNLHRLLRGAMDHYGDDILVARIDMPANGKCNQSLRTRGPANQHAELACEFARLSLAVFQSDPEAFILWDQWVGDYGSTPPPWWCIEQGH